MFKLRLSGKLTSKEESEVCELLKWFLEEKLETVYGCKVLNLSARIKSGVVSTIYFDLHVDTFYAPVLRNLPSHFKDFITDQTLGNHLSSALKHKMVPFELRGNFF